MSALASFFIFRENSRKLWSGLKAGPAQQPKYRPGQA